MKYKIITDSTADLSEDWAREHDVDILGLTIELEEHIYQTVGPDKLQTDTLLSKMGKGAQPKTSQINAGHFSDIFKSYVKDGWAVIYLAFTSGLSGTYQSSVIGRQIALEDYPQAQIAVVDTKAATAGEALVVMKTVEYRDQGLDYFPTLAKIEKLLPRIRSWIIFDDLFHLQRGGRLSMASAVVGSLASIKPIITIGLDGKLKTAGSIRSKKKGYRELVKQSIKDLSDKTVAIGYSGSKENAESVKEQLLASGEVDEVIVLPLGPVISSHTGNNALGIFSIGQTDRD